MPTASEDNVANNLSGVLDEISRKIETDETPDSLTIDEILDSVGRRSYGPLLLVVGLFSISPATILPGMTWLSAALVLLIAGQMALGMKRTWLPKSVLRVAAPRDQIIAGVAKLRPWAARIDSVLKPRLTFLAKPPFVNLVALFCMAAALVTFPLGLIPFAPLAPGLAIVFFGLGMTAHDGLWLVLGVAAVSAATSLALPLII